jgi:hypothetical protein
MVVSCDSRPDIHGGGTSFRPVRRHLRPSPSAAGTGTDGSRSEAVRPTTGTALTQSPAAVPRPVTITDAESGSPALEGHRATPRTAVIDGPE